MLQQEMDTQKQRRKICQTRKCQFTTTMLRYVLDQVWRRGIQCIYMLFLNNVIYFVEPKQKNYQAPYCQKGSALLISKDICGRLSVMHIDFILKLNRVAENLLTSRNRFVTKYRYQVRCVRMICDSV